MMYALVFWGEMPKSCIRVFVEQLKQLHGRSYFSPNMYTFVNLYN